MTDTSIVEKIKKLLTKAGDSGASEAEAETCARKARELMDEYGVSADSLVEKKEGPSGEVFRPKYFDPWRRDIASQCAKFYGCMAVITSDKKGCTLVGRPSSRVVAKSMIEYLDATVLRLAREYRKSVGGGRGEQLNFERGCGTRIAARLHQMCRVATGESPAAEGMGRSLVLVDELEDAKRWMTDNMNIRWSKGAASKLEGAAAAAGRAAGDRVSLGAQLGGRAGGGTRLLG